MDARASMFAHSARIPKVQGSIVSVTATSLTRRPSSAFEIETTSPGWWVKPPPGSRAIGGRDEHRAEEQGHAVRVLMRLADDLPDEVARVAADLGQPVAAADVRPVGAR